MSTNFKSVNNLNIEVVRKLEGSDRIRSDRWCLGGAWLVTTRFAVLIDLWVSDNGFCFVRKIFLDFFVLLL